MGWREAMGRRRPWSARKHREEDLARELQAHLDLETEEQQEAGLLHGEARRSARRAFGNVTLAKEDTRAMWRWRSLGVVSGAFRNVGFALRTFRKRRGAYVFAMAVLALGIGMTTALFSLVQAVLLRPLPFPGQDALRVIWKADTRNGIPFLELAYPELADLQEGVDAFASVALMPTTPYGYGRVIQAGGREPVQVDAAPVSHDFFRTLGVQPALGRDFPAASEGRGAGPVVILSDRVWRQHFSGDPRVLGEQIDLDGRGHRIIGVMGPEIDFPRGAGLWLLLGRSQDRGLTYMQAITRVRPGYTEEQVQAQVDALFTRLARQYPESYSASQEPVITSLAGYWTGSSRPRLLISLGASFLLLITAYITASNLFLSRALARTREIATRTSLGATSRQIFSQFASEGLAAGTIAGVAGLAVAWGLVRSLIAWAPGEIPRIAEAGIDRDILLFAGAISAATALACSLAPAWMASRLNVAALLREGGARLAGRRRGRLVQGVFTVAQTAVTVILLASSLLIAVSFHAMLTADIGFANRDAVTMNVNARGPRFTEASRDLFYTELLGRLRESPAVTSVGALLLRPLEGAIGWDMPYQAEFDNSVQPRRLPMSNYQVITPGYFETVGTPLLEGRDFTMDDDEDAEQAVVISRSLAERFRRAGHEPVGSRIALGKRLRGTWWTIVGVVADARYRGVRYTNDDIYVNYLQTTIPVRYPVVRGRGTPAELRELVRREAARLDPTLAVADVATIAELVERDTAQQRFNMTLLLVFAIGAVLLAGAGVYSVVAEGVSDRRREIAIRVALGAERLQLIRTLIGITLGFVIVGELAGLAGVLVLGGSVSELLYGVTAGDPIVLSSVAAFLLVVALLAAFFPAWVATKREPLLVLQAD